MKLPINDAPLFAADIDVSDYEDIGIFILTIDELAQIINRWFREKNINCLLRENVIQGGRARPISELELSKDAGFEKVIVEIRHALDGAKIDYYEPYTLTPQSQDFRFITPKFSLFI